MDQWPSGRVPSSEPKGRRMEPLLGFSLFSMKIPASLENSGIAGKFCFHQDVRYGGRKNLARTMD